MNNATKKQAIDYAMQDIGLTSEEAENAYDNFFPSDENRYCDKCRCILDETKNCLDSCLDDYCTKCWNKWKEEMKSYGVDVIDFSDVERL